MRLPEHDEGTKARLAGLQRGLGRLGWFEGRNIQIDYRFAGLSAEVGPQAKELVALQPDLILCMGSPPTQALQQEAQIVFVGVADPIGSGFVTSLARPGGNITGFLLFEASITGKWLALVKEIELPSRRGFPFATAALLLSAAPHLLMATRLGAGNPVCAAFEGLVGGVPHGQLWEYKCAIS